LKILYILSFLCLPYALTAQWYDPDKVNKKAGDMYGQAYEDATAGNYAAALVKLNDALKAEPRFVDVYLSRAGIYANLKN
jgi:Tfp pilus assembly protein PilF